MFNIPEQRGETSAIRLEEMLNAGSSIEEVVTMMMQSGFFTDETMFTNKFGQYYIKGHKKMLLSENVPNFDMPQSPLVVDSSAKGFFERCKQHQVIKDQLDNLTLRAGRCRTDASSSASDASWTKNGWTRSRKRFSRAGPNPGPSRFQTRSPSQRSFTRSTRNGTCPLRRKMARASAR